MIWWHDDMVIRWYDDTIIRWYDDTIIRWYGDTMIWWYGDTISIDWHPSIGRKKFAAFRSLRRLQEPLKTLKIRRLDLPYLTFCIAEEAPVSARVPPWIRVQHPDTRVNLNLSLNDMMIRWYDDMMIWRYADMPIWWYHDIMIPWYHDMVTWWYDDMMIWWWQFDGDRW